MTSWTSQRFIKRKLHPTITNPLLPPSPSPSLPSSSTTIHSIHKSSLFIPTFSSIPLNQPIESIYTTDIALYENQYDQTLFKINQFTNQHSDSMITFIIPSINRNTLYKSILSVLNQTITNWKLIIIFDNCEPIDPLLLGLLDNSRILYFSIKKKGEESKENQGHGSAGLVRNIGMNLVTTPWIGFVDDDDTIHKNYIEYLIEEINYTPKADLILFRMVNDYSIIPSILSRDIKEGNVGISFCVKTQLINEGFLFNQSRIEDFTFIKNIESHHKKIVISPFIAYYVHNILQLSINNIKRIIIN